MLTHKIAAKKKKAGALFSNNFVVFSLVMISSSSLEHMPPLYCLHRLTGIRNDG